VCKCVRPTDRLSQIYFACFEQGDMDDMDMMGGMGMEDMMDMDGMADEF